MRLSKRLGARAAATATTLGLALAGAAVLTPSADAAVTETNFGFQATAYGARALSPASKVNLKRVPFSFISCTRLAGKSATKTLEEAIGLPSTDNPLVQISAVKSTTRSYKDLKHKIAGASQGTSTVGSLAVGGLTANQPLLTFDSLKTTSTAWATTDGKLHARNDVKALDLDLDLGGLVPETGTPLDDLLKAVDGVLTGVGTAIDQVIDVLSDNVGGIEIPGLGKISLLEGFDRTRVSSLTAEASSFVIRIQLYGLDGAKDLADDDTPDDFELNIGRSWARLTKGVRSGVMAGVGVGARESYSTDDVRGSGDVAWQQEPCEGTRGTVRTRRVASLDLGDNGNIAGQLDPDKAVATGLSGSAYGYQGSRGKATAWTRGKVTKFALNGTDLVLEGVVGRTTVTQSSSGAVTTSFAGSHIDRILVNGKVKARDVTPRNAGSVRLGTIPGVERIRFFVRDTWRRGGDITAVKLTLTEPIGTSSQDLGFARAAIKRY